MENIVRFLDLISAQAKLQRVVRVLAEEYAEALAPLSITDRFLLRYPFPISNKEIAQRQLKRRYEVFKQTLPFSSQVSPAVGDAIMASIDFMVGLSPGLFDRTLVEAFRKGLRDGALEGSAAAETALAEMEQELSKLGGYDA